MRDRSCTPVRLRLLDRTGVSTSDHLPMGSADGCGALIRFTALGEEAWVTGVTDTVVGAGAGGLDVGCATNKARGVDLRCVKRLGGILEGGMVVVVVVGHVRCWVVVS
jgi:hypothetical protein